MPKPSDWRRAAQKVIYPLLEDGRRRGLRGGKLRIFITRHYHSYCPRRLGWPYTVWKDELSRAIAGYLPDSEQLRLEL